MVKLSKETHLEMFTKMERIREFDSRINKLVRRGFVQGMTHFSVGEEAANVGAVQHLSYDDIFFSNHRGHGQSIAQDMDLNKMMAELAGKATGVSKGRGGSMHLADFKKGNYGTNGIVGGGYALAVGAALTHLLSSLSSITVMVSQWISIRLQIHLTFIHVRKLMAFLVSTVKMVTMFWLYMKQWARLLSMSVVAMVLLSLR